MRVVVRHRGDTGQREANPQLHVKCLEDVVFGIAFGSSIATGKVADVVPGISPFKDLKNELGLTVYDGRRSPAAILGKGVSTIQGYLFVEQGELRIRHQGERYVLTVKGEGTLSREEWEEEIPAWVFEILLAKTDGRIVEKIRYSVPYQGLTLEVDVFRGRLQGLATMECEFLMKKGRANLCCHHGRPMEWM